MASERSSENSDVVLERTGRTGSESLSSTSGEKGTPGTSRDDNRTLATTTTTDPQLNSLVECRYRPQKYCAVCGDRAIACNFNAVTCESCKAFFRRNAFKEQRLKCLFENRCVIDRVTRRFCSKCRLLKCFSIGMKREWILTDEQKQVKRAKIMQNKQHRQQQVTTSSPNPSRASTPQNAHWRQRKKYSDCDSSRSSLASDSPNASTGGQYQQAPASNSNGDANKLACGQRRTSSPIAAATKDAATCCPDRSDPTNGSPIHYCSLSSQCQFCHSKINYEQRHQQNQVFVCNAVYSNYQQKAAQYHLGDYENNPYVSSYSSHQHANQLVYHHQQHQATSAQAFVSASTVANNFDQAVRNEVGSTEGCLPTGHYQARCQYDLNTNGGPSTSTTDCCCPSTASLSSSSNQIYQLAASGQQSTCGTSQLPQTAGCLRQEAFVPKLHLLKPAIGRDSQQPANIVDLLQRANSAVNLSRASTIGATDGSTEPSNQNPFALALDSATSVVNRDDSPSAEQKKFTCLRTKREPTIQVIGQQAAERTLKSVGNEETASDVQQIAAADQNTTTNPVADNVEQLGPQPDGLLAADGKAERCSLWKGENYFEPASSEEQATERINRLNFNHTERQLMIEMMEATTYLFDNSYDKSSPPTTLDEIVIFCDASLRKLIKSFKQINAFRILSMDDQILLLKTACFKVLLLRSAYHYYDEFDGFYDHKSGRRMKLDILKRATKSLVYEKHIELLQKIPLPLRRDRIILSILAMALLFDPNVNLKHASSVELDNLIYLSILRKYLVGLQPDPLGKYKRLVEALQVLNACNEEYNIFFSKDFQPEQVTPLLIEIFDIPIK